VHEAQCLIVVTPTTCRLTAKTRHGLPSGPHKPGPSTPPALPVLQHNHSSILHKTPPWRCCCCFRRRQHSIQLELAGSSSCCT
jgi:hypothetical protein